MKSLTAALILVFTGTIYGQNVLPPHMYLMNQTMINPAYAGLNDKANLTLISRGQWIGVDGAPFTHTVVGSSTISDHSAAGLSMVKDSYGINSDTEIKFHYSYRIEMLSSSLSFGLQGGMTSFAEDYSKLDVELSDPLVGSGKQLSSGSTFGFGMMYKSDQFYLGLAVPRIKEEKIVDNEIHSRSVSSVYNISGGLFIRLLNGLLLKPSFLISHQDNEWLSDINGQLLVGEKIWLGASLRNFNSGGINFIYTEDQIYHFGYSFQFPFNELGSTGYGTHELMLSIDMKFGKRHNLNERYF